jgi:hypothetical protein
MENLMPRQQGDCVERRSKTFIDFLVAVHQPACHLLTTYLYLVQSATPQAPKALLLFGGQDHKNFLGCLNCVDSSAASVCNDNPETDIHHLRFIHCRQDVRCR